MKNRLIGLMGILALVLVFGIVVVGCPAGGGSDKEDEVSKFEGTWKNENQWGVHTLTFTGDKYDSFATWADAPGQEFRDKGSFTYEDTAIIFNSETKGSWAQSYQLSEKLWLGSEENDKSNGSGTYIKQN